MVADVNSLYYYNDNWQVLAEYNDAGVLQMWFVYGNYIDEVLMMRRPEGQYSYDYFYVHDHLYSPAALIDAVGGVVERYEYDAYGQPSIMDASYNARSSSSYDNPYLFTGRRVDFLDDGELTLQLNRHRSYDYYTGRWLTQDPLGIDPAGGEQNPSGVLGQYSDGLSLYGYGGENPMMNTDPRGLTVGLGRWIRTLPGLTALFQSVCLSYTCEECCAEGAFYRDNEKNLCKAEARILAVRYKRDFRAWARRNRGYQFCFVISGATMRMGLDSGLKWFTLREMQNFDARRTSWWTRNISAGYYVGVFHRCNKDRNNAIQAAARNDVSLDPYRNPWPPRIALRPRATYSRNGWMAP